MTRQATEHSDYDVIVIGGGPAGAAAGTLVAERGYRVLLLEKAAAPQFKIGESLMPATYWTLDRLGVLDRMKESFFPKKYSVQFVAADGKAATPFYFYDTDPHESSQTWQVSRREFDAMLLDNAADKGVEVRRGVPVREVLFEGDRAVGVRLVSDGDTSDLTCRAVVDASGQRALLARQLGLLEVDPCLKQASFFTHFEGGERDSGVDEGATIICHTADRQAWFWYIPLPEDRVSVGVVGSLDYIVRGRVSDPQAVFDEELEKCPAVRERLRHARQARPVQVLRDFSYTSQRLAGNGWVLAGDAFGFLDPIYSTGVFLALKSGEMAADALVEGLQSGDLSAAKLGCFEDGYREGLAALKRLVYAFYTRHFSFGKFLKRYPEHRDDIVNILVGNVFRRDVKAVFGPLDEMCRPPDPSSVPEVEA